MKIFVIMLCLCSFSVGFAQVTQLKSEAEIRALIKKSLANDSKISDIAKGELSNLDANYIPLFFRLVKKGKPCEQVEVAELIVELEPKNKEIVPILVKLARGGNLLSLFNLEEESICRRNAAFLLASSADGICELIKILQNGDTWEKQSSIFAFDDLTETTNYPDSILQVMKEAIPVIGKFANSRDQILKETSNEVLNQIINHAPDDLKELAKKYVVE